MKRKIGQIERKGAPAWMTTYGDMVTLLLTFFVLLYSFSSVDSAKWQNLVGALSGGSGVLENIATTPSDGSYETLQMQLNDFQNLYNQLEKYVDENGLDSHVEMSKTDNEIRMRFVDNVLFDSGSANLKPMAEDILTKITQAFLAYDDSIQMVRIEGHTDNVAINTAAFPSNWELSTARAVETLRFLIENQNLQPSKVSAVGYGEYHPIGDNNTEEGRSKNRRVDFVIARTGSDS